MDAIQPLWLVIEQIDDLPWDHALYLGGDKPWNASTPTAVLDPDDVDGLDEDENPAFAEQAGLRYVLSVQEVQGIVANARQQKSDLSLDDLVVAFNFYYDNDAYIEW
jgi:hypothetical protein